MLNNKTSFVKIIAMLMIVVLMTPCYANAAVIEPIQPMASDYFDSYNSYICAMGGGRLEIWFTVVGDYYMDEIGSLRIMLYESSDNVSWTWKNTFIHNQYPSMLGNDDIWHSSYVSYQGIPGRYYQAYVCLWAGSDGNGDTRYMWTAVERAT